MKSLDNGPNFLIFFIFKEPLQWHIKPGDAQEGGNNFSFRKIVIVVPKWWVFAGYTNCRFESCPMLKIVTINFESIISDSADMIFRLTNVS